MASVCVCRVRRNPLPKQRPMLTTENLCQQARQQGQDRAHPGVARARGKGRPWHFRHVLWVQKLVLKG